MRHEYALQMLNEHRPCDHKTVDPLLGTGGAWFKCRACALKVSQEALTDAQDKAYQFNWAINTLRDEMVFLKGKHDRLLTEILDLKQQKESA